MTSLRVLWLARKDLEHKASTNLNLSVGLGSIFDLNVVTRESRVTGNVARLEARRRPRRGGTARGAELRKHATQLHN